MMTKRELRAITRAIGRARDAYAKGFVKTPEEMANEIAENIAGGLFRLNSSFDWKCFREACGKVHPWNEEE
jgi:hypothetical protein